MQLLDDGGMRQIDCAEVRLDDIAAAGSSLAGKILRLLADSPDGMHASRIARKLAEHEQKIYYHTRKLQQAGIIMVHHTQDSKGGIAKVLALTHPAFAIRLGKFETMIRRAPLQRTSFLAPFVERGKLQASIIVGSPDPHGPEQARSRDANYAIDLGIFLGTFLTVRPTLAVQLDTELRDWNQNLIIVGGPVVNKAAERINLRSPARYDRDAKAFFVNGKRFSGENLGVIVRMPNPYAKGKWVLYIAGRRHTGTKAAILALVNEFPRFGKSVTVVEGIDADSDGLIERAKIIY